MLAVLRRRILRVAEPVSHLPILEKRRSGGKPMVILCRFDQTINRTPDLPESNIFIPTPTILKKQKNSTRVESEVLFTKPTFKGVLKNAFYWKLIYVFGKRCLLGIRDSNYPILKCFKLESFLSRKLTMLRIKWRTKSCNCVVDSLYYYFTSQEVTQLLRATQYTNLPRQQRQLDDR